MKPIKHAAAALVAICAGMAVPSFAGAGQEQTVKAFATWQGRGQMYATGPTRATFVGSISGMVFVETDKGPQNAGLMICPSIVDVDTSNGTQEGKGRCTMAAEDGARAYGDIACKGVHLIGCDGDFTFTGGTDRFAGISGGGPITIRGGFHEFSLTSGNTINETAGGIMFWQKLTYKLPAPPKQ